MLKTQTAELSIGVSQDESHDRIVKDISERIRNGVLAPGTRLQSENKLSELYGANLYSIRKAVAHLKADNLLYSVPKFGVFVGQAKAQNTFSAIDDYEKTIIPIRFSTRSSLPAQRKLWKYVADSFAETSLFAEMETVYSQEEADADKDTDIFEYASTSMPFDHANYADKRSFLNVKEYFPGAVRKPEKMPDDHAIPFYHATPVLLYNLDLLKKLGFNEPSYGSYSEQMAYLEEVTAAVSKSDGLKIPGTAQAAMLRMGNYLQEIFLKIKDKKLDEKSFLADYMEVFAKVTAYWKKYLISFPKQAKANYSDFVSGQSPFFFGMNPDYVSLLASAPDFKYGASMMYSVDDTFCRILMVLSVRADTPHPVENLRLVRHFQNPQIQQRLAEIGAIPLDESDYQYLPYQIRISGKSAAAPVFFRSAEEHYVCTNIINVELWNIILFNKDIKEAMRDCLMFSSSYLNKALGTGKDARSA